MGHARVSFFPDETSAEELQLLDWLLGPSQLTPKNEGAENLQNACEFVLPAKAECYCVPLLATFPRTSGPNLS